MTSNNPKIELKNLKTAEFASEETHCYEATVYVDGKRFCIASNQGHGGPDSYDCIRPRGGFKSGEQSGEANRALTEAIHEVGLRYNPNAKRTHEEAQACKPETMRPFDEWDDHVKNDPDITTLSVFEMLVGDALTRALYLKDFRSAMKGRVLMIEDGKLYRTNKMRANAEANGYIDRVKADNPKAKVLNDLPLDEALDLFIGTVTRPSPTA